VPTKLFDIDISNVTQRLFQNQTPSSCIQILTSEKNRQQAVLA